MRILCYVTCASASWTFQALLFRPNHPCVRWTPIAKPAPRRGGVSRLSAHLHFGMVSPFRVAREALAAGTYSAHKFVDEFLTWREVAYAFCFYHSAELDTLQARHACHSAFWR